MSPISTDPQGFLPQPARFAAGASAAATVPPGASRANWEHKRVFSVIAAKLDSYRSLSFFPSSERRERSSPEFKDVDDAARASYRRYGSTGCVRQKAKGK